MNYLTGTFNYDFYNGYLKTNMNAKSIKLVEKMWSNQLEHSDKLIDYMCFQFVNTEINCPNGYIYNELNLLDICSHDNLYLPVFVENINTSSPYAQAKVYWDDDDDNNDDDEKLMEINAILDLIIPGYDKVQIKNKINKFVELSPLKRY